MPLTRREFLFGVGLTAAALGLSQCAPAPGVPRESTVDPNTPTPEKPGPVLTPAVTPAELRVTAVPPTVAPSPEPVVEPTRVFSFYELRGLATELWAGVNAPRHWPYTPEFKTMLNEKGYAPLYANVTVSNDGVPAILPSVATVGLTESGQRVAQLPVPENLFDPTLPDTDPTTDMDQAIVRIGKQQGVEFYGVKGTTETRTKILTTVSLEGWPEHVIAVSAVVIDPNRAGGLGSQRILLVDTQKNEILGDLQAGYDGDAVLNYQLGNNGPQPYLGLFRLGFTLRGGVQAPTFTPRPTMTKGATSVPENTQVFVSPTQAEQATQVVQPTHMQGPPATQVPQEAQPSATPSPTEVVAGSCPRTDARQTGWDGRASGETTWIGDWPNTTDFREFSFQVLGRVTGVSGDGVDVELNSFVNPLFTAAWSGTRHLNLSGASITILKPRDQRVVGQSPECAIGWGYSPSLFVPGDELFFHVRPFGPVDPNNSASIQGAIDAIVAQTTLNAFFVLMNQ